MQKALLIIAACLLTISLSAQRLATWDGPETGNWNDATNWDLDMVPVAGDTVAFVTNATVGGTTTGTPVQLRISGGAQVTLDLDLTIGGGSTANLPTILLNGGRLVMGDNTTTTLEPAGDNNGFQISAIGGSPSVNVKGSATVNITGGRHGLNISNPNANFVQRGTLNISNVSGNGIRLTEGTIDNRGGITITSAGGNGIDNDATIINFRSSTTLITVNGAANAGIRNKPNGVITNDKEIVIDGQGATNIGINSDGAITNMINSDITVSNILANGIDLRGGSFTNDGTVSTTAGAAGTAGNAGLLIGTNTEAATFTNTSDNSLNADGGTGAEARAILIRQMGSLENTGTITLTGGQTDNRINSSGSIVNDLSGVIDLTDGRITNSSGTLENNGFITTTKSGSGIFTGAGATSTNNAFFGYGAGNFSSGASGTIIDEGINLNQFNSRTIDAMGMCEVKIANAPYTYTYLGTEVGTSDATGNFSFDPGVLDQPTVNIKPVGLPNDIFVRIQNACAEALPVELTDLQAISMAKSIIVKWATASETESDFMAVEHSADGQTFREIGRVAGAGNSSVAANYELEDFSPVAGTNFYRLRQVDFDGTANFSHVVSADFAGETTDRSALRVYPTTLSAGQRLRLDLRNAFTTQPQPYYLIDADGHRLKKFMLSGGNVVDLPLANLRPGMYFLTTNVEGAASSARFIISGK